LEGAWDFTLSFSAGAGVAMAETTNASTGDSPAAATPDSRVTLFEALESLGLKLETTKRPGPVFVIDRMERRPLQ
jgi:uncharacterized protein (TIGR03435 family)